MSLDSALARRRSSIDNWKCFAPGPQRLDRVLGLVLFSYFRLFLQILLSHYLFTFTWQPSAHVYVFVLCLSPISAAAIWAIILLHILISICHLAKNKSFPQSQTVAAGSQSTVYPGRTRLLFSLTTPPTPTVDTHKFWMCGKVSCEKCPHLFSTTIFTSIGR